MKKKIKRRFSMRVIHTTENRRYGSNCLIHETTSLIEDNGLYNILYTQRISGSIKADSMVIGNPTENFNEALKSYKFAGGEV